jgi:hypothetical protein
MAMPEMFPMLPKELEVGFWTRGRSKLAPKTGLGEKLKKVGAAYNKIKVGDINKLLIARTPDEYSKALDTAMAQETTVPVCTKQLQELAALAGKKAKEAKASKRFPKKTRILIERIAKAAKDFETSIGKALFRMMKEGHAAQDDYEDRLAHKTKLVKTTLSKLEQHAKTAAAHKKAVTKHCKKALQEAKQGGGDMSWAEPYVLQAQRELKKFETVKNASNQNVKAWASDKTKLGKSDAVKFEDSAKTIARLQRGIVEAWKVSSKAVEKTAADIEQRRMIYEIEKLKRERLKS